jgi:D-alanyl-D-alanine carboxypeptidase
MNNNDFLNKREGNLIGILFLTILVSYFYIFGNPYEYEEKLSEAEISRLLTEMTHSRFSELFDSLDLKASSVVVLNSKTGDMIYKKDENRVMPLASIVKISSALVFLENTEAGEVIKIPRESLRQVGDHGLLVDEEWERDSFLDFMLITSSNDAARAAAMHVGSKLGGETEDEQVAIFVQKMNDKTSELGFDSLVFLNDSGLDMEDGKNGGYGSAKDVALLFDYALKNYPETFSSTSSLSKEITSLSGKTHTALNTNQDIPNMKNLLASKTGFTNISGGNLAISIKPENGDMIIISVLGSTFTERFTDVEKLAAKTLEVINEFSL